MKTLMICTDDDNGMSLFNRRLSTDAILYQRLAELAAGRTIHMSPYSAPLFKSVKAQVDVRDDFMNATDGFFFVERGDVDQTAFDRVLLVRWNRRYPSDRRFSVDPRLFRKMESTDIVGAAHDRITLETYGRNA